MLKTVQNYFFAFTFCSHLVFFMFNYDTLFIHFLLVVYNHTKEINSKLKTILGKTFS